jgi:hypothetical protein
MNRTHLEMCSSAEWAEAVERWILPWVLPGRLEGAGFVDVDVDTNEYAVRFRAHKPA